jgi:hypothetical protein
MKNKSSFLWSRTPCRTSRLDAEQKLSAVVALNATGAPARERTGRLLHVMVSAA